MDKLQEFQINAGDVDLHAKLELPEAAGNTYPMVIVVHGFTGDMEEEHIVAVKDAALSLGFVTLRVEMYGHGQSGGKFRDHTVVKWVTELLDVIDYAKKLPFVSDLYLAGHSQGGLAIMLAAALKADVIKAILPLAPAICIRHDAETGHTFDVEYDPQNVPDELVFDDGKILGGNYIRMAQFLPIEESIAKFKKPVLIVHSDTDETVPYKDSVWASEKYADCRLVNVPNDTHCFDNHLAEMISSVQDFLREMEEL